MARVTTGWIRILPLLLLVGAAGPAASWVPAVAGELDEAGAGRASLEQLSRQVVNARDAQGDDTAPASGASTKVNVFSGRTWRRVKHASLSLIVPGWSHYRADQKGRAFFFLGAEAAIWTSYTIFEVQGHRREDAYKDFAMQFAGVAAGNHDDAYWKAVGNYLSNEDYNEVVRRDLRAGIDPEGPEYFVPEDWLWRSPDRFDEYGLLRSDSNNAYHNADLVITWAIINRIVAFVDALRSAPLDETQPMGLPPEGLSLDVDVDPSWQDPATKLMVRRTF
jgi:hypothetical protein